MGLADPVLRDERIRLFDSLYTILEAEYADSNLACAGVVLMHLLATFRFEAPFRRVHEPHVQDLSDRAIQYMKAHLEKSPSLEEIAGHCQLSVSHFSLVFKKKTSHTPIEYLNNLRIQYACQLLDLTTLKINEISSALGYSDPFYFSHVFKKLIGLSPRGYRRQRSG